MNVYERIKMSPIVCLGGKAAEDEDHSECPDFIDADSA